MNDMSRPNEDVIDNALRRLARPLPPGYLRQQILEEVSRTAATDEQRVRRHTAQGEATDHAPVRFVGGRDTQASFGLAQIGIATVVVAELFELLEADFSIELLASYPITWASWRHTLWPWPPQLEDPGLSVILLTLGLLLYVTSMMGGTRAAAEAE